MDLAKAGTRLEIDLIEGRRQGEVTATVLFDPRENTCTNNLRWIETLPAPAHEMT